MPIYRTIECDICAEQVTETELGDGFAGWGELKGIALDGVDNPALCPKHLEKMAIFMDKMKNEGDT